MAGSEKTNEAQRLIEAGAVLSRLAPDTVAPQAVCANLETALALAETIEDIGLEAAPVFRA